MKKILLLGEIDVNCYFIEHNRKCYIVDPGYEKEKVIKYVEENELEVLGILLTHGHIDHIGAIDSFNVPIYLHEKEYDILQENYTYGFEYYGKVKPYVLEDLDIRIIDENSQLAIDERLIEVIYTPGHTIGGLSFKFGHDLYTGDTLFKGTVGKWEYRTGDINTLGKTIIRLIDTLDEKTRVHPAHGPSSTIGAEKNSNFFYLKWKNDQI
ncbi:glyoxylase-like metal-dependent hydrolase (beta-lactamase superfamily II) [Clostridium algifaecis]|uniref:Glyoxylase-like metal-dependent hydrolase (Beta-lactamase superfamily II) n=1 Tax=Clostridium algifaecis TaxID=1472040 RepID=A0ABS4KTF6_9CLOT|nr:MBL fold metallo-hydrolase [Clostridium algifaecis]MBP2033329.1 glyoxylase-like metal-dependent hydrolase (beta-lactamase superfamily II) [Clostridium algifaecis]